MNTNERSTAQATRRLSADLQLRIAPETRFRLDAVARRMDRTTAWIARKLIDSGLRRLENGQPIDAL